MSTTSAYSDICISCNEDMELKRDTHKHMKDNSIGLEVEEYDVTCPKCGRLKHVKIEKQEVK